MLVVLAALLLGSAGLLGWLHARIGAEAGSAVSVSPTRAATSKGMLGSQSRLPEERDARRLHLTASEEALTPERPGIGLSQQHAGRLSLPPAASTVKQRCSSRA